MPADKSKSRPLERRQFIASVWALVTGVLAGIVPVGAGLVAWLHPLRRSAGSPSGNASTDGGTWVKVTQLEVLPADGVPRKFSVLMDRVDAWNKTPNVPVGAVYVRRTPDKKLSALNVICPHAGCFVEYQEQRAGYMCPCHNSWFSPTGEINDPNSPSPRGLDGLAVEVRGDGEVWVRFQNFQSGHKAKIPLV